MKKFTIGIRVTKNNQHFFILRRLDKYVNQSNTLDFKEFYKSNYAIFETPYEEDEQIISLKNGKISGYINFEKTEKYIKKNILKKRRQKKPINHIFFLEGAKYYLYDNNHEKIAEFVFQRRKGKIGIVRQKINGLGMVKFIVYPSKIIDNSFLEKVINNINEIFPNAIIDSKGGRVKKKLITNSQLLKDMSSLLSVTKGFEKKKKIMKEIAKKDFDISESDLSHKLESYILEKGGFSNIDENEMIPVEQEYIEYNTVENQVILYMLENISKKLETSIFDEIIRKYKLNGVQAKLDKIPQKLHGHPVYMELIKLYNQTDKYKQEDNYSIDNIEEKIDIGYDSIKSFTYIYEIHCFLKLKEFMERLGTTFIDKIEDKLYDSQTSTIIAYDKNHKKGFLEGYLNDEAIKIYFLDKLHKNHMRDYQFWMPSKDYKYLGEQFKKINSRDGLNPDISLEINNRLIICDVKFSSFRDLKSQLDFPNPDYFIETLHKYKRIIVNGELNPSPIIIFYPGHIDEENIKEFKYMQDIVLHYYNMLIFPIYDNPPQLNRLLEKKLMEILGCNPNTGLKGK